MALRAAKQIDWTKVKAVLAKEDFALVSEQRSRHLELSRTLAQQIPKLDLSHYKQILQNQELVSDISSAVSSFKPHKPSVDHVLSQLDSQKQEALKVAQETVDEVEKSVSQYKTDLASIKNLPHYDNLTPDAVYESAPGLEQVYHDRLRDGKLFHDDHNFGQKFI